ncbi:hypothetical protein PVT67_11060 [Gallaecimonas kandeliae]|uniref:hypothetical protein n=1 Tax=Gallaecimonas kandeliae TaxID=3029055 RepID=UPI0026478B72|nr:hypothetical protein [Gallaecimonas kandeliae]WKE64229.1 hypothetical protein PVT67_11060 [Gallaecimonas kandeliae]
MARIRLLALALLPGLLWAAEAPPAPPEEPTFLRNLFHIDQGPFQQVFRREPDTDAVILVGPQGNKFYAERHPKEVQWYSTDHLDIIRIPDPKPGPWQALGEVQDHKDFAGVHFAEPRWPSPRYVGEQVQLCQSLAEPSGALTQDELHGLVQVSTFLTSAHLGEDDNFGFNSTPKTALAPQGKGYCTTFALPVLAGHYHWRVEDRAGFDKMSFGQDVELKRLPIKVEVPTLDDPLAPHLYRLTLTDDSIPADSVRAVLELHLGNRQNAKRIVRLTGKVGELRYPQTLGHNISVTGILNFEDSDGQARTVKLADQILVATPPPPVVRAPAPEQPKKAIFSWWWLLGLLPVVFAMFWWRMRAPSRQVDVVEKSPERPEIQQQASENDGFLLDLSRPDDIDEKI